MPRSRLVCAAFVLAFTFITVPSASAAPITLNYVGGLFIWNPIPIGAYDVPAQTAYGVNSPVSLSITIDPNAAAVPIGGGYYIYPEGLLGGTLRIGSFEYRLQRSLLDPEWRPFFAPVSGPSVTSNGLTLTLDGLQFNQSNGVSYIGNVAIWQEVFAVLNFHPGGSELLGANLQLVSVSVPEPRIPVTLSGGALAFFALNGWRRKRR